MRVRAAGASSLLAAEHPEPRGVARVHWPPRAGPAGDRPRPRAPRPSPPCPLALLARSPPPPLLPYSPRYATHHPTHHPTCHPTYHPTYYPPSQRVVCVVTPLAAGVLWEQGGEQPRRALQYSYVPVIAWLKSYPAHSPQLLPEGLVHEDDYITPKAAHLTRLPSRRPAPPSQPQLDLASTLPQLGKVTLLPLSRCGAQRCHLAGWCGEWIPAYKGKGKRRGETQRLGGATPSQVTTQGGAACHCLRAMNAEVEGVRREAARFSPRFDAGECAPHVVVPWKEGDERPRRAREPREIQPSTLNPQPLPPP